MGTGSSRRKSNRSLSTLSRSRVLGNRAPRLSPSFNSKTMKHSVKTVTILLLPDLNSDEPCLIYRASTGSKCNYEIFKDGGCPMSKTIPAAGSSPMCAVYLTTSVWGSASRSIRTCQSIASAGVGHSRLFGSPETTITLVQSDISGIATPRSGPAAWPRRPRRSLGISIENPNA